MFFEVKLNARESSCHFEENLYQVHAYFWGSPYLIEDGEALLELT